MNVKPERTREAGERRLDLPLAGTASQRIRGGLAPRGAQAFNAPHLLARSAEHKGGSKAGRAPQEGWVR